MTALTPRQIRWLRIELGNRPTDQDLQESFDLQGNVRDAAIALIRARINELVNSPLTVNISGIASVNSAENVKALERQISRLAGLDEDPSDDSPSEGADGDALPAMQTVPFARPRTRGRRRW